MRWLDIPPVWLLGSLALAWLQAHYFPMGLTFGSSVAGFLGGLLVGAGLLLMALAVYEMRRQKTTVIPHRDAENLVTTGIFSRSRNPIYLGDVLLLTGFIINWGAILSLPLIPIFLWIIERRFVVPEENRLRRKFRADYARYWLKTRRWV